MMISVTRISERKPPVALCEEAESIVRDRILAVGVGE
jgi:hypothetical protein